MQGRSPRGEAEGRAEAWALVSAVLPTHSRLQGNPDLNHLRLQDAIPGKGCSWGECYPGEAEDSDWADASRVQECLQRRDFRSSCS